MQNRTATTIALLMCALAVVVPIAAALYLARRQSTYEATAKAMSLTSEITRRTEMVGEQASAAYARMRPVVASETCSSAVREKMREIAMDYGYVQAVGRISGNRVVCSALGPQTDGIDLGTPSYVSPGGTRVYLSAAIGGSRRFVVTALGDFAVAVHPQALLDVATGTPGEISQGVFGHSSRQLWAHRGAFDPAWMTALGMGAHQASLFDGKHLVVIRSTKRFDLAAYTAIPVTNLESRLHAFMIVLLPIALALGAAMVAVIVFFTRLHTSLPTALRVALKRKEFVLHYQPIVELATGHMVGAEALLRWPLNKQVGARPNLFIQAAEDCGLIQRFTEYVLAQVAIDGPRFFSRHPGAYISVNLSSPDMHSDDVVTWLRRLVTTPGVAPYNIVVEVTEHSFVDPVSANRIISQIHALGVRVAIDDFGTGFSSLSQLTKLSADYLKIDKVFVDAIGTDSVTSEVALHIIDMAKSLNLTLISEGVETQAQADFLREHGVVFAQGWLFSQARPLADLIRADEAD
ncbi:MAG TPA: EAL domain-containing protein [Rhodanobacter sp.]|nr:EAL domain-containing protein [Rhodanobacter sp.]